MTISAVSKERYCNKYYKLLFIIDINGCACFRCYYSLAEEDNAYLIGVRNNSAASSSLLFIEK